MEPKVIFEDSELLVLDKPSGMIVNKSNTTKGETTLQDWIEEYLKIPKPKLQIPNKSQIQNNNYEEQAKLDFVNRAGIVHRLDKETSGIILVAKNLESFINLQAQFKERKVKKTYLALVHGKIEPQEGEIDVAVGRLPWSRKRFGVLSGGRESVTKYKTINNLQLTINNARPPANSSAGEVGREPLTLVELYPKSGRTHQIRVHLQYIHHPIFSDPLYAGRKTSRQDRKLLPRVFLHASKISFQHPKANMPLFFESPLPNDLKQFLATLTS